MKMSMTLALPAESIQVQATAPWTWLLDCVEAIRQALQSHRHLTAWEQRFLAVAEDLGRRVLQAESLADLHARLHAAAKSEPLLQLEATAAQEFRSLSLSDSAEMEKGFARIFGESHLARDCARLLVLRFRFLVEIYSGKQDFPDAAAMTAHAHRMADFRTPPVLRSLFDETLVGEVALLALLAPRINPERWDCAPWIQRALLEQIRTSSLAHIRLMSLVPRLEIPEEVLAQEDRLDIAALEAESRLLARYVIRPDTRVASKYASAFLDDMLGDSPPPAGVLSLFED